MSCTVLCSSSRVPHNLWLMDVLELRVCRRSSSKWVQLLRMWWGVCSSAPHWHDAVSTRPILFMYLFKLQWSVLGQNISLFSPIVVVNVVLVRAITSVLLSSLLWNCFSVTCWPPCRKQDNLTMADDCLLWQVCLLPHFHVYHDSVGYHWSTTFLICLSWSGFVWLLVGPERACSTDRESVNS